MPPGHDCLEMSVPRGQRAHRRAISPSTPASPTTCASGNPGQTPVRAAGGSGEDPSDHLSLPELSMSQNESRPGVP